MKSLKSILAPLKAALLTVTDKVYHYEGLKDEDRYIVWAEDADNSVNGDNKIIGQAIQGTVDYFTSLEYDENIDKIHVKGSGDLWMVAIWEEDDLSFSITFEKGLTQDELASMIDSIK